VRKLHTNANGISVFVDNLVPVFIVRKLPVSYECRSGSAVKGRERCAASANRRRAALAVIDGFSILPL
jgi:hypothetical protein